MAAKTPTQLTFNKVPTTKIAQQQLADLLVSQVTEGDISPVEAVVKAKALVSVLDTFIKDKSVTEQVIIETGKYGKGEYPSWGSAKVEVRETGVKYDFSNCNDSIWDDLNSQIEKIKAQMKERENFLRVITKPKTELDPDTGEVFTINPPARSSTTSYAVTFNKQ